MQKAAASEKKQLWAAAEGLLALAHRNAKVWGHARERGVPHTKGGRIHYITHLWDKTGPECRGGLALARRRRSPRNACSV